MDKMTMLAMMCRQAFEDAIENVEEDCTGGSMIFGESFWIAYDECKEIMNEWEKEEKREEDGEG